MMMRFPSIFSFSKLAVAAAVVISVTHASAALAEARHLACQLNKVGGLDVQEQTVADLQIDIENNLFEWGAMSYTITGLTTRYITAVSVGIKMGGGKIQNEDVGSEIFAIDRVTGDYQRAAVFMAMQDFKPGNNKLVTNSWGGRCLPQKF